MVTWSYKNIKSNYIKVGYYQNTFVQDLGTTLCLESLFTQFCWQSRNGEISPTYYDGSHFLNLFQANFPYQILGKKYKKLHLVRRHFTFKTCHMRNLCMSHEETTFHMLFDCPYAINIWLWFSLKVGINLHFNYITNIQSICDKHWSPQSPSFNYHHLQ